MKQRGLGRPFSKGRSGNPYGRPPLPVGLREACKALTDDAIAVLSEIMKDRKASASARISAATAILDRAHGRPKIFTEVVAETGVRSLSDKELYGRIISELQTLELINAAGVVSWDNLASFSLDESPSWDPKPLD
jgi:hypothetical protein